MRLPTRRSPRLTVQRLEDRTVPATNNLYIDAVMFAPEFGNQDTQQFFEIRGQPGATIPSGTYFTVVDGSPGAGAAGTIHAVFDLSGLQLGSNGYLVVTEAGNGYSINPNATVLKGTTTGFGGLPNNRFTDDSTLSNRFAFIFGPNTFMLVNSPTAPVAGSNVDPTASGTLSGAASQWTVLDSVGVLGNFVGPRTGEIAYGQINFANGGVGQTPAGSTLVTTTSFGYVARVGPSAGYSATDWVAGNPKQVSGFVYRLDAGIFGVPSLPVFAGRTIELGTNNFVTTISGTVFNDANGNGALDPGESGLPGVSVFLDQNNNNFQDSVTTAVNPDNFSVGTDLTNAVNGVTLTTADSTGKQSGLNVAVFSDPQYSTTGFNVIGPSPFTFWTSSTRLRMDFYKPVQSVSVDFIATTISNSFGRLEVYSANGTLLQTYLSSAVTNRQVATLAINRSTADIAYAIAYPDPSGFPFNDFGNILFTRPENAAVSGSDGSYQLTYVQDGNYTVEASLKGGFVQTVPSTVGYNVTVAGSSPVQGLLFGGTLGNVIGTSAFSLGTDGGLVATYTPTVSGQYAVQTAFSLPLISGLEAFSGVVRTASADVNGDGTPDLIVATGPGQQTLFAVIDGTDMKTLLVGATAAFPGSEGFTGGAFISAGDFNRSGRSQIVLTPDQGGGPRVTIYSLTSAGLRLQANFYGISDPNFRGGARAAVGDVNGDSIPDLLVAAGYGGGPRVALFNGRTLFGTPAKMTADFFVFADVLRNGVYPGIGDLNGDGFGDLVFGAGPGGGPRVLVISGQTLLASGGGAAVAAPLANFFVNQDQGDRGGVRIAVKYPPGNQLPVIVTGSGEGQSPALVRVYSSLGNGGEPPASQDILPFGGFPTTSGIFVG